MTKDPTIDKALAALALSPVLGALSPPILERLAAAGSPWALEARALLFQAGEPGDAAYVLLSGELEIRTTSAEGRDVRIGALGPGALVGEMAALDGGVRSADVAAARRASLWRIPRQALIDCLASEPSAALAVIGELSRRLRAANGVIERGSRLDVGGRLAVLLLEERNRQGGVTMTQTEIARRLGCSREQVNRKLQAWTREGWLSLGSGGVQVRSEADLQSLVRPR
jgi:CRP/FNR family cyclic AMP-dependent transcriptional regulator